MLDHCCTNRIDFTTFLYALLVLLTYSTGVVQNVKMKEIFFPVRFIIFVGPSLVGPRGPKLATIGGEKSESRRMVFIPLISDLSPQIVASLGIRGSLTFGRCLYSVI